MKRGLFFSFFIYIAIALGFVALIRVWYTPRSWVVGVALLLGWAAVNAFFLASSVRRNIVRLEVSTAAIPERKVSIVDPSYTDFDGLARAISVASDHVEHALARASENRRELEAMIDSMQDAVVAVDAAGRIQWSNQRLQRLITDGSAVRLGHALVAVHPRSRRPGMCPGCA